MTDTTKTCSRAGCGKKLYQSNTSGLCSSGCLSPEAPPSLRARGVKPARELSAVVTGAVDEQARRKSAKGTALARFKQVCAGLGKDPDEELEAFAQGWLDALLEKLEDAA